MKIRLVKPTGIIVERPTGFSWTTFFFGMFPAMFRNDWKYALIMVIAAAATCGLSQLLFIFKYNKWHLEDLLEKGYKAADAVSHSKLIQIGLIAQSQQFENPLNS